MAALFDRFRAHLEATRLFREPGVALVAVSGGADSVALLDLLHGVAGAFGLSLVVAHADHGIRADSRTVGRAVRALAERYDVPFELGELALGPDATETVARRARYAWLRDVQRRRSARYLVTAHHRDDQAETVLLRVLSGSGLSGLAGIPMRSRGGLVRPLLPFTRDLLPVLEERVGDVREKLLRLGRHAGVERRAWNRVLDLLPDLSLRVARDGQGFDVARAVLARYDDALAGVLLGAAARRVGLVLGPVHARRLATFAGQASGRRMDLPGGWVAEIAFDRLRVSSGVPREQPPVEARDERGETVFGEFLVRWEPAAAPHTLERAGWTTWLTGGAWQLRPYQQGDRLLPLGGVGRRPVRRLLMEAQVPRGHRGRYPVVARGETILWVPGVCRSAADLPSPGTPAVRLDVTEYGEPEADRRA